LLDLLGEGGMGSVWRARCLRLDIDVAIKLVRGSALQPNAAERLRLEAQAAARVRHPATVRVLDFGTTPAGEPFLVMELLAGQPLAALLRARGRLPEREAVRLLLPIASGLTAAHESGVIHRDIKPANIIIVPLDEEGCCQPKLVDFGLAKVLAADADDALSEAGLTLGSMGYMAPEQLRADPDIDASADVWALSVVLYELITGELPFEATKPMSYLSAIIRQAPRPTTVAISGDTALWAILERGLARSRAGRWPSMAELGGALARWAMDQGETTDVRGVPLERWSYRRPSPPPLPAPSPPPRALWDLTGVLRFL
jgi:serine/threonine protein kinase